ncbi:MAG TPA: hypothetical protein VGC55_01095 [Dokdonella sp.]
MPWTVFALAFMAAATVHAEEAGRDVPYEKVYEMIQSGRAADPDGVFRVRLCAQANAKQAMLPADLAIELRNGARTQALPLDAKHCFDPPLAAEWTRPATQLHINQPKGSVSLALSIEARLPATTRLSYARLTESVPAMQRVIATQGMLARLMGPKLNSVVLKYRPASAATAVVHAPGGEQRYASDANGDLRIPYDPALADVEVELSALPQAIDPDA